MPRVISTADEDEFPVYGPQAVSAAAPLCDPVGLSPADRYAVLHGCLEELARRVQRDGPSGPRGPRGCWRLALRRAAAGGRLAARAPEGLLAGAIRSFDEGLPPNARHPVWGDFRARAVWGMFSGRDTRAAWGRGVVSAQTPTTFALLLREIMGSITPSCIRWTKSERAEWLRRLDSVTSPLEYARLAGDVRRQLPALMSYRSKARFEADAAEACRALRAHGLRVRHHGGEVVQLGGAQIIGGTFCFAGVLGSACTMGYSCLLTLVGGACCCYGKVAGGLGRAQLLQPKLSRKSQRLVSAVLQELHVFGLAASVYSSGCRVAQQVAAQGASGWLPSDGKLEAARISSMIGSQLAGATLGAALAGFSSAVIVGQGVLTAKAGDRLRDHGKAILGQAEAVEAAAMELLRIWPEA